MCRPARRWQIGRCCASIVTAVSRPLIEARAGYEYPAFSPDGRRVAVTIASETGSDIWIIDLERAHPHSVHGRRHQRVSRLGAGWLEDRVSVDGSRTLEPVLEAARREQRRAAAPESADSSAAPSWPNTGASLLPGTLPTLSGAGPQFPMSWSPDGSTLAFHERKPNGERDIWVVSPGSDPVPFLLTPFDERSPRFSPDGKWLAYVSDESGRNDVYVQPFPGPGPKWLVSTDGGIDPVWSKDGRELFYRRDDQMMAVSVAPKGEFSAGRPRRLFEIRFDAGDNGPNYDVSPDGNWFVMPRSDQGRGARRASSRAQLVRRGHGSGPGGERTSLEPRAEKWQFYGSGTMSANRRAPRSLWPR